MSFVQRSRPSLRPFMTFRNKFFLRWDVKPTPNHQIGVLPLIDYPQLLNIFAAILHNWRQFLPPTTWRRAMPCWQLTTTDKDAEIDLCQYRRKEPVDHKRDLFSVIKKVSQNCSSFFAKRNGFSDYQYVTSLFLIENGQKFALEKEF